MFRFCPYLLLHISCSLPISLPFSEDFILFCVSEFLFMYIRQPLATKMTENCSPPRFPSISSRLAVVPSSYLRVVSSVAVLESCLRLRTTFRTIETLPKSRDRFVASSHASQSTSHYVLRLRSIPRLRPSSRG